MEHSRTKLVCTIGPASAERIGELVAAGMDVARINFSHGMPDDHREYVHSVRAAAHNARRSVAVMADLPGAKIRLGQLRDDMVILDTGATFTLRAAPARAAVAEVRTGQAEPPVTETAATPNQPEIVAAEAETPAGEAEVPGAAPEMATEPVEALPIEAEAALPTEPETPTEAEAEARVENDDTVGHIAEDPPEAADAIGDASGAWVSTSGLAAQLQIGDRVLMADGAVELRVIGTEGGEVHTEVMHGGQIRTRSGVNIPSSRLTGDGLTDDDRAAVPRALELRVDVIAQSFVRNADDVRALKQLLPTDGPRVVAKIETQAAVDAFDEIAKEADGIMVARGDLGVDIPFEDVPLVQKDLIRRATAAGRFTIVATQMLESMTAATRPTRAEASDVANAVLDGTDAVMLSAETAIGAYPLDALQAMARICVAAERAPGKPTAASSRDGVDPSASIVMGASLMADHAGIGAVWCFTRSGRTAELLSLQRPLVPIVAFTLSPIVARRLAVRSAVVPVVMPSGAKGGPLIERMENAWRSQHGPGGYDTVLLVTTSPQPSGINRLELHRLAGTSASR